MNEKSKKSSGVSAEKKETGFSIEKKGSGFSTEKKETGFSTEKKGSGLSTEKKESSLAADKQETGTPINQKENSIDKGESSPVANEKNSAPLKKHGKKKPVLFSAIGIFILVICLVALYVFQDFNDKRHSLVPTEYNIFNCTSWRFTPSDGLLLFFPAELYHSVDENKSNITRYSLAFNIIPIDTLGSEKNDSHYVSDKTLYE